MAAERRQGPARTSPAGDPFALAFPEGLGARLLVVLSLWIACVTIAVAMSVAAARLASPGYDFRHFWLAGQVWIDGLSPYGPAYGDRAREVLSGGYLPENWAYPPSLFLPTLALASFPIEVAWAAWLGLQILCLVLASAVMAFCLPAAPLAFNHMAAFRVPRPTYFALHLLVMAASEASSLSVSGGQLSQMMLLAAVLIIVGLIRRWHTIVVIGLLLFFMKPHLGAPLAVGLVVSGATGRRLVGRAAALTALLLLPAIIASPTALSDWLDALRGYSGANTSNLPEAMTGLRNLLHLLGGPAIGNFTAAALGTLVAAPVAIWFRRAQRHEDVLEGRRLAEVAAAMMLVAMAVSPLHVYDFILIGAAFPLIPLRTLPGAIAVLAAATAILWPGDLFEVFSASPPTLIFPGSHFATVGAMILLIALVAPRRASGTTAIPRHGCA